MTGRPLGPTSAGHPGSFPATEARPERDSRRRPCHRPTPCRSVHGPQRARPGHGLRPRSARRGAAAGRGRRVRAAARGRSRAGPRVAGRARRWCCSTPPRPRGARGPGCPGGARSSLAVRPASRGRRSGEHAVAVGAEHVVALPEAESWLVSRAHRGRGGPASAAAAVLAVVGGRGGAGASVLAAAVAVTAVREGAAGPAGRLRPAGRRARPRARRRGPRRAAVAGDRPSAAAGSRPPRCTRRCRRPASVGRGAASSACCPATARAARPVAGRACASVVEAGRRAGETRGVRPAALPHRGRRGRARLRRPHRAGRAGRRALVRRRGPGRRGARRARPAVRLWCAARRPAASTPTRSPGRSGCRCSPRCGPSRGWRGALERGRRRRPGGAAALRPGRGRAAASLRPTTARHVARSPRQRDRSSSRPRRRTLVSALRRSRAEEAA